LWLKEGFATYFARFVCDALEPNAGWKSRAQLHQIEGKNFDAKSSTHPLESTVSNSGEANEVRRDLF
jgi:aminopeptidase N